MQSTATRSNRASHSYSFRVIAHVSRKWGGGMGPTIRPALGVATLLAAALPGLMGVLSFFSEPLIDQGNPPVSNVYEFSGGMILQGTPDLFALAAVLASIATAILYKSSAPSRLSIVLYRLTLIYATLAAVIAFACAGLLFFYGHKYA
jgi:hypothetical protein